VPEKLVLVAIRRELEIENSSPQYSFFAAEKNKKHLKNVGPIRHCEPPHAACFPLPFTRCRYCRTPPAHRCPQQHRQQRQRVTEGTAMAPWNGPNKRKTRTSLRLRRARKQGLLTKIQLSREKRDVRWVAVIWPKTFRGSAQLNTTRLECVAVPKSVASCAIRAIGLTALVASTKELYIERS